MGLLACGCSFQACGACGLWRYVRFLWAAARLGSAGHFGLQTECILRRTWQLFSVIFWEGIKPYCINFSPAQLGSYVEKQGSRQNNFLCSVVP